MIAEQQAQYESTVDEAEEEEEVAFFSSAHRQFLSATKLIRCVL